MKINIIISNILVLGILTYLGSSFLTYRFKNRQKNILIFVLASIICGFVNNDGASSPKSLLLLCIYSIFMIIFFKGRLIKKILVVIPFFIIILISEIFVALIMNLLDLLYQNTSTQSLYYNFGLLSSLILALIISFLYTKIIKCFKINELPKYTVLILIIPLITIFLLTRINDYFELMSNNKYFIFLIIALFMSNVVVIITFFFFVNNMSMNKEIKIMGYKESVSTMKYNLLKQQYNHNFNFLHQLLHDSVELKNLLKQNDLENLDKKIDDINNVAFKEFNAIYTNSNILNNIINSHIHKIMNDNIEIKSIIKYNNFFPLTEQTTIELFSFLLDLAIFYCETVNNDRIIIFKTERTNHQIIIQMIFSSNSVADNTNIYLRLKKIIGLENVHISIKNLDDDKTSIIIFFPIVKLENYT